MTGCKFPEHHGGGGFDIIPIVVVVGLVALGASAITAIIHILTMVLTFVALGTAVSLALGVPLWIHRRHVHRELVTRNRPQVSPAGRPGLPQDEPRAIEQHVHHHYGISLDELAQAIRNQGSRNG